MKTLKKILFLALFMPLLMSCDKDQVTEPDFYQISGTIYDRDGMTPLEGVNVCLEDTTVTPHTFINQVTDVSGKYLCTVYPGWSGLVTPGKVPDSNGTYVFNPCQLSYRNVHKDFKDQDYVRR